MNRQAVMTLANALHYKKHLSRSESLKRAWRMIKQSVFNSKAVGVSFGLRQQALLRLKAYALSLVNVTLKHEPGNKHDKNAVAVMVSVAGSKEFKVGYLSSSSLWAGLAAKGLINATVSGITGGGHGMALGFNFKITVNG